MSDVVGPGDLVLCVNAAPNHVTGLPVLGVLPDTPPTAGQDIARELERDPASALAEAVRGCRTAVLFGMPDGHAKTILITSKSLPCWGQTEVSTFYEFIVQDKEIVKSMVPMDFKTAADALEDRK